MTIRAKLALSLFVITSTLISLFSYLIFNSVSTRILMHVNHDLLEHLEHEWAHLISIDLKGKPPIPHYSGMYHRILDGTQIVVDNIPPEFKSATEIGVHENHALNRIFKVRDGKAFEVVGLADLRQTRRYLRLLGVFLTLGVLILAGLFIPMSWWLSGIYLLPFRNLARQTALLDASELSFRFPYKGPNDEFGKLVSAFNLLLGKMELSFREANLFAAKASHELKTPLASIISQTEKNLRRSDLPEEVRLTSERVLNQTLRLSRVAGQLLKLADVSGKRKHKLNYSSINPLTLLEELRDAFATKSELESKTISISVEGQRSLWVDADLLSTALGNLIENALKFGQTKICLNFIERKGQLMFSVEDDGPGITPENRERAKHLFEKSETLFDGTENTGSGLGLSITSAAVEILHGQLILADSRMGGLSAQLTFRANTMQKSEM